MVIDLGDNTARQLMAAASSEGMTVDEYVRAILSSSLAEAKEVSKERQKPNLIGAMTEHSDLFDEVLKEAYESRERDPLRVDSDG